MSNRLGRNRAKQSSRQIRSEHDLPSEKSSGEPLDERVALSFQFASETVKQLITISSAILAITLTFKSDIIQDTTDTPEFVLIAAWIAHLVSILCGIVALMGLTGELSQTERTPDLSNTEVRIAPSIQIATFLFGIALLIWFGAVSLDSDQDGLSNPNQIPTSSPSALISEPFLTSLDTM